MRKRLLFFGGLSAIVALPACGATGSHGHDASGGVGASATAGNPGVPGTGGAPASGGMATSGGASVSGGAATEDLPFAVSGQRLEAWFLTMDGGGPETSLFSTFHDTLLDLDCEFVPSSTSGLYVCVPITPVDLVYLDSACTQTAVQANPDASAPPTWMSTRPSSSERHCVEAPAASKVAYRLGEQLFAGGIDAIGSELPEIFARVGANCEPTQLQWGHVRASLYRLDAIDESNFVRGRAVRRQVSTEFAVERLIADDGAALNLAVLGRDGEPCEPQTDGVCVPTPFMRVQAGVGFGSYVDASCTERAFVPRAEGWCSTPKLGLKSEAGTSQVYELAPTVAFSSSLEEEPDAEGRVQFTCQPDSRGDALAPGVEVTSQLLRAGRTEIAVNGLRWLQLRAPLSANAGAGPLVVFEAGGAFVDSQGLGCSARATADGQLTCIPAVSAYGTTRFRDASCQHRLYDLWGSSPAVLAESAKTLRGIESDGANEQKLVSFKTYSGKAFELAGPECVPAQPTELLLDVDREWPLPRFTRVRR